MKFRFCGEGDCPDWVLAEIISTLSVLSAQKLKSLAELVAQKITGQAFEEDAIKSLTADVAADDGKSAVACVHYLLTSAARHNASESVFNEEIQQLGLPKEHAAAMCCVLNANATPIRQKLIAKSLKINELSAVQFIPASGNTINCAKLELKISKELVNGLPQDSTHTVNIDRANLKALLEELKEARSIMQKYDMENIEKVEI